MTTKVPGTSVPSTSGQGVSRKAYQTSRNLGFKGTGSPGSGSSFKVNMGGKRSGVSVHPRDYGKSESAFNVDYGDTMQPPELKGMWSGPKGDG